MPFAEFQPSNAGAQALQMGLAGLDAAQSLMDRVQRRRLLEEDNQRSAAQAAANLALTDRALEVRNLELTRLRKDTELDSLRFDTEKAQLEAQSAQAQLDLQNRKALSGVMSALPGEIEKLIADLDGEGDYFSKLRRVAAFESSPYATVLKSNPALAGLANQISSRTANIETAHLLEVRAQRPELAAKIAAAKTEQELSALVATPMYHEVVSVFPELEQLRVSRSKTLADVADKAEQRQLERDKKTMEVEAERGKLRVPGYEGAAPTETEARAFRESEASLSTVTPRIDRLIEVARDESVFSKLTDLELRGEMNTLASLITAENRTKIVGPGAVSESEWALLRSIIANPSTLMNTALRGRAVRALETLKSTLIAKQDAQAAILGLRRTGTPAASNPASGLRSLVEQERQGR